MRSGFDTESVGEARIAILAEVLDEQVVLEAAIIPVEDESEDLQAYESFVDTMLYGKISITLEDIKASLNSKELQKKVMVHHGSNDKGLVVGGRLSKNESRGKSKSKGRKSICWNYNEEGHLKRDCPKRRGNKGKLSGDVVVVEEICRGGDILTATSDENACAKILTIFGTSCITWILDSECIFHVCYDRGLFSTYLSIEDGKVLMVNGDTCDITGVGEVRIKQHTGSEMLLAGVRHVPRKKYMISLGAFDKLGYKYMCQGRVASISKDALGDEGTVAKGHIEGTCQGQVEKPRKMLKLGSKAPIAQPSVEIIQGRSEWRLKSLRCNSLQAGDMHSNSLQAEDRHSEQLRWQERCGLAELVVSCDAEVGI
ncbi:hypothetical protein CRG98_040255 [Punica granatum]|uniref:Retrovirus-related Pol polyprotein from transposon TNT 1-94-like beta-barrel domain-containing protein n=1 Tax=Punica granatum TaxID=22663 RepID=A0A2I0I5V6_PUNGR|nr:hypothetical protein CRG98_040255 [Punica granatum]